MIAGFKKFIIQGNAVDLAVGIVIGIAFKAVVDKIVSAVINPLIGGIFGKPNFDNVLTFTVGSHHAVVSIGAVITQLVNFLLVALAVYFLIVMPINALNDRRKRGEQPADEQSNEDKMVELLERIA